MTDISCDDGEVLILESVRTRSVYAESALGSLSYDELQREDGTILVPSFQLPNKFSNKNLIDFGNELEPVPYLRTNPILRTRLLGNSAAFAAAVFSLGSNTELAAQLESDERRDAELYQQLCSAVLSRRDELWVRLEAGLDADPQLHGKVMIGRLAWLMSAQIDTINQLDEHGIVPIIFSKDQQWLSPIPSQLRIADPWLYVTNKP
ncbi:hypothetical protein H7200_02585 [Candidatus Saccharibacteria bacterium]|nr:hypothetical protein [Candidatus Saccharibacteria bacterium]